ncbi:MAG: hypothetical protein ACFCU6_03995, partial [Balneolaceae bacterium]
YGRDLYSINWYAKVFKNRKNIEKVALMKCPEISIISSKYNWGALWSGYTQPGVPYYSSLFLEEGEKFTLIVPEAFEKGFSVYDLEELDIILLNLLNRPLKIGDIFELMKKYFEEDIITNRLSELQLLLINLLEQFILKKAVKPFDDRIDS